MMLEQISANRCFRSGMLSDSSLQDQSCDDGIIMCRFDAINYGIGTSRRLYDPAAFGNAP